MYLNFCFYFSDSIPIGITISAIGLKISAIPAGIKKYQSIIREKKKKHDKIALLEKSKSNSIEVLISEVLIDSVISHDEFVLVNNILNDYSEIKKEIINFNNK